VAARTRGPGLEPRPLRAGHAKNQKRIGRSVDGRSRRGNRAHGAVERMERMTEVKLSHWVADQLVAHGIRDAFMLTGGGAMHLNHSIGTHPEIKTAFCHHEHA